MNDMENILIMDTVTKFLQEHVKPKAQQMERENRFDFEAFKTLGNLGYVAPYLPEVYGGAGLDLGTTAAVYEEMAKVDAGFAMSVFVSAILFCRNIYLWGTDEQKLKYLPPVSKGQKIGCWALTEPDAGSDAFSIKATYTKDAGGFRLNGSKTLITNAPIADYFLIIARNADSPESTGATWFILERGMEGLVTGKPIEKMGLGSSPTGEIYLDNVYVTDNQFLGKEGQGFLMMLQSLDVERCLGSVISLGLAAACFEASVQYSSERKQFGRYIADFQLIKEKIAEMAADIDVVRVYLYHTLKLIEANKDTNIQSSICKYYASKIGVKCASEAVQIYGGYGYTKEYPVERYYRDAKMYEVGGGTNEIQKIIIAGNVLKKRR